MNLIELQQYTISYEKSEEYLQAQGIFSGLIIVRIAGTPGWGGSGAASISVTVVGRRGDQDEEVSLKD